MPRTEKQYVELRNRKIELIESTAMKCFATRGFHNTSMSSVAKEAGISTGLTYNYFASKEELLKSIYLKGIRKIFSPLEGKTRLNKGTFRVFIEHIFFEMENNVSFWRLYFIIISQPEILSQFQGYMMETAKPIMTAIMDYFKNIGMPEPEVEARFLFSVMDGVCINYLIDNKDYPLKKMKEKILKSYVQ